MHRARVLPLLMVLCQAACGDDSAAATASLAAGGEPDRGARAIRDRGCGTCHRIEDVPGATGLVGPSLENFTARAYIAGKLTNTPENVVRWVMSPQTIAPGTAMPDLGIAEAEARDIVAYLYGGQ